MKAISEGASQNIRVLSAALVLAGIGFVPVRADAGAIQLNTWYEFQFQGVDTPLTACSGGCIPAFNAPDGNPIVVNSPNSPWTITLHRAADLRVVDLFLSVDQFQMYDHSVPIGATTVPIPGGDCGGDITCSLGDFDFSRGDFFLGPGAHSFTGRTLAGIPGAAVFEVAVPEPSTWAMMLIGFAGLGFAAYRSGKGRRHMAA